MFFKTSNDTCLFTFSKKQNKLISVGQKATKSKLMGLNTYMLPNLTCKALPQAMSEKFLPKYFCEANENRCPFLLVLKYLGKC